MIFAMTPFTFFHVLLSLIGIFAGMVVLLGFLAAKRLPGWTLVFLSTTVATSVTGFGFARDHILPSHIVGIISLVLLPVAIFALYSKRLAGAWRPTYVVTAALAQYLNVFVLIVQSFLKIPALHALAPTQTEAPFKSVQAAALVVFVALILLGIRKFHPSEPVRA
jgi:hypothetical protein